MSMMRHTAVLRVRYADTDQMRLVYNARYLEYFEVARTELLRSVNLPYRQLEDQGYQLPVLEAHLKYIAGAQYDDELSIDTRLTEAKGAVIRIQYTVTCGTRLIAEGFTRHAFVSATTGKPCRPPQSFLALIALPGN
jgi:acyl-CoA thioester hydrolase